MMSLHVRIQNYLYIPKTNLVSFVDFSILSNSSIGENYFWLNLNYGMSTVPNRPRREAKNGLSHVRFFGKHVRFFRHLVRFFD